MSPRRALTAFLVAFGVLAALAASSARAQEPPKIVGELPLRGGIALVQWSGGTVDSVAEAALPRCDLASVWASVDGRLVGHVLGAPAFVNAEWAAAVGEEIEAQPLLLACSFPDREERQELSCPGPQNWTISEFGFPVSGHATSYEAVIYGVRDFTGFLPGTLVQGRTIERIEGDLYDARVTWELVADDGSLVGLLDTGHLSPSAEAGEGWLLTGGGWCVDPALLADRG